MKKVLSLIVMFSIWITFSQAQIPVLANWSFPNGTAADSFPDLASPNNVTKAISTQGGTSAIDFSKNGATTKSAQATNWDNGKDTKFWQVEINSTGYQNLILSSKISTGGTFPGPRDFKAQYKLGSTGSWTDIDSGNFKTANNWTTGVINGIELPGDCDDQPTVLIRWIMTSDTANDGSIIANTGICKIDDINISGETTVGIDGYNSKTAFQVYPNPSTGTFTIQLKEQTEIIQIYNMAGEKVYECQNTLNQTNVNLSSFGKGLYILKSGNATIQKIFIR